MKEYIWMYKTEFLDCKQETEFLVVTICILLMFHDLVYLVISFSEICSKREHKLQN